jgi:hypothetical protein
VAWVKSTALSASRDHALADAHFAGQKAFAARHPVVQE